MESKSIRINLVKAKPETVQKKFVIKHIKPSTNDVQVYTAPSKPLRSTPPQHQKIVQVTVPSVNLQQAAQLNRSQASGSKKYSLNVPLIQVNIPRLEVRKA